MKDIHAIKGKFYLRKVIAEGEHEHQDFKFAISDARKIARSISAFANNSGGRLLIGVKDNGVVAGVRNEEDIYVVEQAAQLYCRPAQTVDFTAIKGEEGALVIRADIKQSLQRPVQASEPDGTWRAYYRVADENILATPLMVRAWKRKTSGRPALFSLCEAEQTLIDALARNEILATEEIMRLCMLSQGAAEDMIVRLYALGIIDFRFVDRSFRIVGADPSAL